MHALVRTTVNYIWILTAAVIIAAATLVSVVRLMLPHVEEQRVAIESWITEVVGHPVSIAEIRAQWHGWAPEISVTGIALLAANGIDELIRFEHARIRIAPARSLAARALVPRDLTVSGVKLDLVRNADGSFAAAGMAPGKWPVAEWLLQQQNFAITRAQITFVDAAGDGTPLPLDNVSVSIRSVGGRPVLLGMVDLPDELGKRVLFRMNVTGHLLTSDWGGDIHVELQEASAARLLARLGWHGAPITSGGVDIDAWTHWERGRLTDAFIRATGRDFALAGNDTASMLNITADTRVQRTAGGWAAQVERLRVTAPQGDWPETALQARWRSGERQATSFVFAADFLRLEQVVPVLLGLAPLAHETMARVADISPSGVLRRVRAGFRGAGSDPAGFYIEGNFDGFATRESGALPGLSGARGTLRMNSRGGTIHLDDADLAVTSSTLRNGTLELADANGHLSWERQDDAWLIGLGGVSAVVDSIALRTRGRVRVAPGRPPQVDLVGAIDGGDLTRLRDLFPVDALPPAGQSWLDKAFVSGAISGGGFVLRGNLDDFPFDGGSGVVRATLNIAHAEVKYARAWPHAREVDARIALDGRAVMVDVGAGKIFDADIVDADIHMPDAFIKDRQVRISGTTHGTADDAIELIMQSPLKKSKAARMTGLKIDGEIDIDLDINIPLRRRRETEVLGKVRFDGNRVHSDLTNITLDKVRGSVSFTRNDWYGEGLDGEFENQRIGLVVNGGLDDPNYDSEFRMTGTADARHLLDRVRRYAPPVYAWLVANGETETLRGELPWKAVLTIPEPNPGGVTAPKRLVLSSSLQGLEVALPWPFGKAAGESRSLTIESLMDDAKVRHTRVTIDRLMLLEMEFADGPDGTRRVAGADIAFGPDEPNRKVGPGVFVHGSVERLPLGEWIGFVQSAARAGDAGLTERPLEFDIVVQAAELFGLSVKDLRATGRREQAGWKLGFASETLAGNVEVPVPLAQAGATLEFERIWLSRLDTKEHRLSLDPGSIPPLRLSCQSFRYGDVDLGKAQLVTRRTTGGLHLESLDFHNEHVTVHAEGDWLLTDGNHRSFFNIDVKGKELGALLANFGYEGAAIDGGASTMAIEARWPGMPSDFTLERLNGTLQLTVAEGRFLDIEPGSAGRLFGLLSVQALPRRLSFDFDDLFQKGFAFDSIKGLFELDSGNAYTNSLLMDGPAAKIDVSGRTGLADKDYDQQVVVTPALSSSIPIASALFGPAGIGVGAVIFLSQKMFKAIPEQVDRFLSRQYSITGTWDNPLVERI